jgi:DNA-binding beta-propeller fold protein YncE
MSRCCRSRLLGILTLALLLVVVGCRGEVADELGDAIPTVTPVDPGEPTPTAPAATVSVATPAQPAPASAYDLVQRWDLDVLLLGGTAVGPDDQFYVVDTARNIVLVYAPDGSALRTLDYGGRMSSGPQRRDAVAVSATGHVYVLDSETRRVLRFSPEGELVSEWGGPIGEGLGEFVDPQAIALDGQGHVYVAENIFNGAARVQKFTTDGVFVEEWTRAGAQLFPRMPVALAADTESVYLLSHDSPVSLYRFDLNGNLLGEPLEFEDLLPISLALGPRQTLYVTDLVTRMVVALDLDGQELFRWPVGGDAAARDYLEVAASEHLHLYVTDAQRGTVQTYVPARAVAEPATPEMVVAPARGTCDSELSLIGWGFAPGSDVRLLGAEARGDAGDEVKVVTVTERGTFTGEIIVRDIVADCDANEVTSIFVSAWQGAASQPVAIASFEFLSSAVAPTLNVFPARGDCDTELTIDGRGFIPGSSVTVYAGLGGFYDPVASALPVADDGSFGSSITLTGARVIGCPDSHPPPNRELVLVALTDRDVPDREWFPEARAGFGFE